MFERIETPRLILRKPTPNDAEAIFSRYAGDPEVTRLLSWKRHLSCGETRAFIQFSEAEWNRWPVGPYLIESREDERLLGGTGLAFEAPDRAMTGYVLAKDEWGKGYATESLQAVKKIAWSLGVTRIYALCHPANRASSRVLQKCGFVCEGILPRHSRFPNLEQDELLDVLCFALVVRSTQSA